ncbi:centrosomal protein of 131 kDa-like [Mytilus edulis]|uniref:centrosomal protein of 131 kDa-like n=1 Tax=Mytilus edulis TaxID=6550 RepID=UPI0039F0B74C
MTSRSQKSDLNLSLTGSQISSSSKSRPLHRPSSVTDVRQSKGDVQKSQSSTKKRNSLHGVDNLSQRSDASSARKKNPRQHGRSPSDDFLELFENSMQPKIKAPSASQKKPGPNAVKVLWQPSPKKFGAGDSARTNSTARSNSTSKTNSTARTENKDFDDFLPPSDRQENFFQPSSVRSSSDSEEDCLSSSLSKIQALKEKHKLQQDKMNDLFLSPRDRVVKSQRDRVVKDAVPKASNFSGIANNMVVTSKPQQVKASLSNIENSYQNIKHKTPVNEVKKQDVSQQLKKQDTSQQIGRNIAEDFIKTLNNAATKIQRCYREHKAQQLRNEATVKAGEAALKRLLQQKKQDHVDHKILDLDFLSEDESEKKSVEDRKKLREEKARQARQQAIQELQKKRELKREEVKRKAEEEISYLQASGKITKKPLRVGKKKSPVSPVPSKSKDSNTSVSTLKDEEEDLLESVSNINPGESSRESARKERSEAASTKTTLDDLLDTLKKLEADEQLETPKPVTKNAWLEDIDKDSTKSHLTTEKLQKLNSVGESVSKSGFLTDDKLKSIMTFLDEVQTSDRLSSVDQELAKESHNFELPPMLVPSADELLQLDHAKEAADEVTSTVLSQRMELDEKKRSCSMLQKALNQQRELTVRHAREAEREMNKRLDVQKDEYEEAIKRHLGFIDQLIDDKKSMSEKCEKLVKELKTIDKKYQDKIRSLDDRHGLETQKLKDMHEAAEKLRRERWIEDKTKKIKEMTVKGLEPEIQRLIAKHKSELKKIKQIHEAELLESDERAAQRYVKMTEELRDQLAKEKEAACARERELSKQRYEKELKNEEDAYQQQRRRLHAEVQEEKDRVSQQATRQRTELDRLQRQLEDSHAHALTAMKQEYEKSREEQERRHYDEMRDSKEKLKLEKESWEQNFLKKQETWVVQKERELKEQVKRERDKEIEMVITQLEDDATSTREDIERASEHKTRRLREKYEAEMKDLERSERQALEKYNEMKARLTEVDGENECYKVQLKQKDQEIASLKKLTDKMHQERDRVSDIIRQEFADRLVTTDEENKRLKNGMSEMKARHRIELDRQKEHIEEIRKQKDEEMEEVHKRVKDAILKKEEIVTQIKQQYQAAQKRADHLEGLLQQQRKQLLGK